MNFTALILETSGAVQTVRLSGRDPIGELRRVLGGNPSVLHFKRTPKSEDIAVAWYSIAYRGVSPVNEAATAMGRKMRFLKPKEELRGTVVFTGIDNRQGDLETPPVWVSDVVYRYGRDERDRMRPHRRSKLDSLGDTQ